MKSTEDIILSFLQSLDFPGIRKGEGNEEVCVHLKNLGYKYTPDLVAGPEIITEAPLEGLFFIDVIEPTSDLLFGEEFYSPDQINTPKEFKRILDSNSRQEKSTFIDSLPNAHHDCYLEAINKKLSKYTHDRKFKIDNVEKICANFGLVVKT